MDKIIVQVTPDVGRSRLESVKGWIADKLGITDVRLQEETLRISAGLEESRDLELPVKTAGAADYVLDKKLPQNDVFFIVAIGVFVSKEAANAEGNAILLPYPDVKVFKNAGEAKAINTVYSGKLALEDSHDRRFYDYVMSVFMKVPQVQVATDNDGNFTQYPNIAVSDALVDWNPFEVVSGSAEAKFKIRLGRGSYTGIADSGKNRVTIIVKGIRASNIAKQFDDYMLTQKGR